MSYSVTIFIDIQSQPAGELFFPPPQRLSYAQLPGAGFEVDMQDSSKVIMSGAHEWKPAVFLRSPGSCSDAVGYDTRNWLEL